MNKSEVDIIMLHVDTLYFGFRGQKKYVTMNFSSIKNFNLAWIVFLGKGYVKHTDRLDQRFCPEQELNCFLCEWYLYAMTENSVVNWF